MTQTIEKTGKGWKALHVLASLYFVVAVIWMITALGWEAENGAINAARHVFISAGVFTFSRIGIWWCHG